jgi:hypothetical protein
MLTLAHHSSHPLILLILIGCCPSHPFISPLLNLTQALTAQLPQC